MEILTALGLSAPAGLNAPLVLLIAGLAGRFTGMVDLPPDYDWLESWSALGLLGVWLAVEELIDKIPGADHVNDVVNSGLRPAAGAVLALAFTQGELPEPVAGTLGLALAGATHAAKAAARPLVTVGTLGFGNPVVSTIEDVVALLAAVVAIVAPLLVIVVLAALAWAITGLIRRRRRDAAGAVPPQPPPKT